MKQIFGRSFLIVIAILVTTSISSCGNENSGRYQIITAGGITELMDMKTLDLYYNYGTDWHKVTAQGIDTVVKELPE